MLPTALLATLALAAHRTDADAAFAALVPTDAAALARVASLAELDRTIDAVGAAAGEPLLFDAHTLLAGHFGCPGPLETVDATLPLGIALSLPPGALQPLRTFLLPVEDASAYAAALGTAAGAWRSASAHGYVAISEVDEYAAPSEPSALTDKPLSGVLALRVDAQRCKDAYAPMIEMGVQGMRQSLAEEPAPDPLSESIKRAMPDFTEDLLDALVRSELSLELDGSRAKLALALELDPDSDLGEARPGASPFDTSIPARLPDDATVCSVSDLDAQLVSRLYEIVLTEAQQSIRADMADHPPAAQQMAERALDAFERLEDCLPLFGRRSGYAYTLRQDCVALASYLECSESARVLADFRGALAEIGALLAVEVPEFSFSPGLERTVGGVTFHETTLQLPVDAIDSAGPDARELRVLRDLCFGETGMRLSSATDGSLILFGLGLDDAALTQLAGGSSTRATDPALDELSGAHGGAWVRMDIGELMAFASSFDDGVLAGVDGETISKLHMRVSAWGGVRASTWFGGATVDLDEVRAFVRVMRDAR